MYCLDNEEPDTPRFKKESTLTGGDEKLSVLISGCLVEQLKLKILCKGIYAMVKIKNKILVFVSED